MKIKLQEVSKEKEQLEKFLKFKDNEKEQHARWSSSRGSS